MPVKNPLKKKRKTRSSITRLDPHIRQIIGQIRSEIKAEFRVIRSEIKAIRSEIRTFASRLDELEDRIYTSISDRDNFSDLPRVTLNRFDGSARAYSRKPFRGLAS